MRILVVSEKLEEDDAPINLLCTILQSAHDGCIMRAVDYNRASVSTFFPRADLVLFDVSLQSDIAGPLLRYLQSAHEQVLCLTGPSQTLAQQLQALGNNIACLPISEALPRRNRRTHFSSALQQLGHIPAAEVA